MPIRRFRLPALVLASTLGLSACAYGYGDYGYASVGYGSGYCDPYYDDCYGGGYYGDPWYGWYDNYYYPGWGIYVYDQWRRPHRWNDRHRSFWESRRHRWGERNWNDRRWERWDGWDRGDRREWRDRRDSREWRDRRDGRGWRDRRHRRGWDSGAAPSGGASNQSVRVEAPVYRPHRATEGRPVAAQPRAGSRNPQIDRGHDPE